jgi:hypothetical protein
VEILYTHIQKWKNETCWSYSWNAGGELKENNTGGEFNYDIRSFVNVTVYPQYKNMIIKTKKKRMKIKKNSHLETKEEILKYFHHCFGLDWERILGRPTLHWKPSEEFQTIGKFYIQVCNIMTDPFSFVHFSAWELDFKIRKNFDTFILIMLSVGN